MDEPMLGSSNKEIIERKTFSTVSIEVQPFLI
jgi:hypothetical protein